MIIRKKMPMRLFPYTERMAVISGISLLITQCFCGILMIVFILIK
jgi:hypothetical protein